MTTPKLSPSLSPSDDGPGLSPSLSRDFGGLSPAARAALLDSKRFLIAEGAGFESGATRPARKVAIRALFDRENALEGAALYVSTYREGYALTGSVRFGNSRRERLRAENGGKLPRSGRKAELEAYVEAYRAALPLSEAPETALRAVLSRFPSRFLGTLGTSPREVAGERVLRLLAYLVREELKARKTR